jgi:4-carboxymuconolactone decarboxylase
MSRPPQLDPAHLEGDRKRVYKEIAAHHRGTLPGPWPIMVRIPEAAELYHGLYRRLCVKPRIGTRLFELMVLLVARHWEAEFQWVIHERRSLESGLLREIIDAIRQRRVPPFALDDERLVYELIEELNQTRTLSAAAYERAIAAFGEDDLTELILGAGTYTALAMVINVFGVPAPA